MKKRQTFLFVAFTLIGVILYANSLDNSFHYDDGDYILRNEGIRHLSQLWNLWTTAPHADDNPKLRAHYRPLVFTTYLLNYVIDGPGPIGYHLVNLLIHVLTAFLVALVMERLTGQWLAGFLSGLLFLVHPFNSEAVNYVTARSSQLYAMFYLLSFYAYMRYRSPTPQVPPNPPIPSLNPPISPFIKVGDRGIYFWLALCLLSFALSLLSKEMALTLPVTLFLYEWLIGPSTKWRDRLRSQAPLAAFTLAAVASYLIIRKVLRGAVLQPDMGRDLVGQLATQSVVLVRTLRMILWPSGLTIYHRVEAYKTFASWPVIGACFALGGIMGLFLWWCRSNSPMKRVWAFLLAWFFVALSPLMLLRLNAALQENRAYLAIVGVISLEAVALTSLIDWSRTRALLLSRGVWTGIVIFVLAYAGLTIQRNRVWHDDLSLWSDAVKKEPYSTWSRNNLGVAYEEAGLLDQAAEQYRYFWTMAPNDPVAVYNLGVIMEKQGRLKEATAWYAAAFRLNPAYYPALLKLGQRYMQEGHWDDAIQVYKRATLLWPDGPDAHRLLADVLLQTGHREEARAEYETALQKNPGNQSLRAYVEARLKKAGGDSEQKHSK